jgi:flagellar L-ring protein precursor FlgH
MPRLLLVALVIISSLLVGACSETLTPAMAPTAMPVQQAALRSPPMQQYPPPAPKAEGSIININKTDNWFTDVRAHRVGDIVTINIVETSRASKEAKTDLNRDSEIEAGLTNLLGYESGIGLGSDFAPETSLDLNFNTDYRGNGKTSRNETMIAQISARIIQILPNGNLVIRGSREITVNFEKQYIIVQGVVRPVDISPNNTIQSTKIADARIDYTGKGDVTQQQRKGWGTRLLDFIWPF